MIATTTQSAQETGETVCAALTALGAACTLHRVVEGPTVWRVEVEPAAGVLMRKFRAASDDLAFELGAETVRISAPLAGKRLVSIEIPAPVKQVVSLADMPASEGLRVPIGVDVDGDVAWLDIAQAPHVLIAGASGSGKSTALNSILCSLLANHSPDDLKLILCDVKRVEMAPYRNLPHLFYPVADTTEDAITYLSCALITIQRRYKVMQRLGARTYEEMCAGLLEHGIDKIPYLLVVIDEVSDLMMASRKEAESVIVRIAQLGRACGVHLILATQSPRVQTITGPLKINVPTRIAFSVPSATDSRVVLDQNGAERLMGQGDGLLSLSGATPRRFQGAYTSSAEIEAACEVWR